jgi:hypothetical protein
MEDGAAQPLQRESLCAKRPHMATKPLLLILFEGVLGDVCKHHYFDREALIPLYIRPGLVPALKVCAGFTYVGSSCD